MRPAAWWTFGLFLLGVGAACLEAPPCEFESRCKDGKDGQVQQAQIVCREEKTPRMVEANCRPDEVCVDLGMSAAGKAQAACVVLPKGMCVEATALPYCLGRELFTCRGTYWVRRDCGEAGEVCSGRRDEAAVCRDLRGTACEPERNPDRCAGQYLLTCTDGTWRRTDCESRRQICTAATPTTPARCGDPFPG